MLPVQAPSGDGMLTAECVVFAQLIESWHIIKHNQLQALHNLQMTGVDVFEGHVSWYIDCHLHTF